jgi:hypothetical protein
MEILVLIDKLDDLLHNARPIPLTDQVRLDREEIYDLLDQMRATIPEEWKRAEFESKTGGGIEQEALAEAVSAAIKENIPEIARAVAAASPPGSAPPTPPGAPF